ncbi:MAG TPA: cation diffusion facilitator family transporter [Gemmatimonadales bacterium]|nr:cation diffusion facilitator family transporter [Gemmatimonadales bacterium]
MTGAPSLPAEVQCAHRPAAAPPRLPLVFGVSLAALGIEIAGGLMAHSLALLADAGHMLVDVGALALAWFVARLARRPATPERTFGLLRLEILAALVNGALLIAIAVGIAVEAYHRLRAPPAVQAQLLLAVAGIGLVANVTGAAMLHQGHEDSLNQRAVYLHLLSDALGSLGAMVAGAVILIFGWQLADPLISVVIAALILRSAWGLSRESVDVLLEAAPAHIPLSDVHQRLASLPGVASVHDLHVWTLTSGVVAMSGHLVVQNPADHQRTLEAVQAQMRALGIHHVTVQMEAAPTCA